MVGDASAEYEVLTRVGVLERTRAGWPTHAGSVT